MSHARNTSRARRAPQPPAVSSPLLIDVIFGGAPAGARGRRSGSYTLAWLAALALHAGLFALAQQSEPSLETWSARAAAMVHRELNDTAPTYIETVEPKPDAPEPQPEHAIEPKELTETPKRAARQKVTARTPPPAQPAAASQIVAAEPVDPSAPVDLTAATFITGTASAYAGGATTARGRNLQAVSAPAAPASATEPAARSGRGVRPVSLKSEQWRCPWPAEALAQDLYEQAVIVRAWVRPDGSVEQAWVVSDPGFGFGAAAVACSLRTRFNPARDADGNPVRALSPPIRVRFTR